VRRLAALAALLAAACTPAQAPPGEIIAPEPVFLAEGRPGLLSEWGQIGVSAGVLALGEGVTPYDLNTALFSDYALKLRTVWIPDGAGPALYHEREAFEFPVGTVVTKTFYYPRAGAGFDRVSRDGAPMAHFDGRALDLSAVRLIETRLLVRREAGWEAFPYVWDEAQREARLARAGAFIDLTLVSAGGGVERIDYMVPDVNQCAACHVTDASDGALRLIGPRARHVNSDFEYFEGAANQLERWMQDGLLSGAPDPDAAPRAPAWHEDVTLAGARLDAAARAYLDINCAHCHSRTGPARTSGLYLEPWEPDGPNLGICKPPIAAGRGTGGRRYSIVPGDAHASILHLRMDSVQAAVMMPELGRSSIHREGAALIAAWIDAMSGGCD